MRVDKRGRRPSKIKKNVILRATEPFSSYSVENLQLLSYDSDKDVTVCELMRRRNRSPPFPAQRHCCVTDRLCTAQDLPHRPTTVHRSAHAVSVCHYIFGLHFDRLVLISPFVAP